MFKKAKQLNTPLGQLVVAAMVFDDIIGLILISVLQARHRNAFLFDNIPKILCPALLKCAELYRSEGAAASAEFLRGSHESEGDVFLPPVQCEICGFLFNSLALCFLAVVDPNPPSLRLSTTHQRGRRPCLSAPPSVFSSSAEPSHSLSCPGCS